MKGVPEEAYTTQNLIKKRIRDDEVSRKRAESRVKDVMMAKRKNKKKEEIKDPEYFCKNYRKKQRSYVVFKRKKDAVVNKTISLRPKATSSIFAIRIKHPESTSSQESKLLSKLLLTKKHNARFFTPSLEVLKTLKLTENYIIYGHPSKTVIDELIRTRGFVSADGQKVAITDNTMVEDKLSSLDIICIEDIVQSLAEGKHVEELQNDFLHTFLLSRNKKMDKKYNKQEKRKVEGGKHGYVGTKQIDLIIRKYF